LTYVPLTSSVRYMLPSPTVMWTTEKYFPPHWSEDMLREHISQAERAMDVAHLYNAALFQELAHLQLGSRKNLCLEALAGSQKLTTELMPRRYVVQAVNADAFPARSSPSFCSSVQSFADGLIQEVKSLRSDSQDLCGLFAQREAELHHALMLAKSEARTEAAAAQTAREEAAQARAEASAALEATDSPASPRSEIRTSWDSLVAESSAFSHARDGAVLDAPASPRSLTSASSSAEQSSSCCEEWTSQSKIIQAQINRIHRFEECRRAARKKFEALDDF